MCYFQLVTNFKKKLYKMILPSIHKLFPEYFRLCNHFFKVICIEDFRKQSHKKAFSSSTLYTDLKFSPSARRIQKHPNPLSATIQHPSRCSTKHCWKARNPTVTTIVGSMKHFAFLVLSHLIFQHPYEVGFIIPTW